MPLPAVSVFSAPGVPPVNNLAFIAANQGVSALAQDFFTTVTTGPQWGIFLNGQAVITAESVTGFEFRKDFTVADFPVEGGQFDSYDKVQIPYLAKVRFAAGYSNATRASLLASVDAASVKVNADGTFPSYQVVTPEYVYTAATISHYDYRRVANQGVGLIVIDVWLTQIMNASSSLLRAGNVGSASGVDQINSGFIQAQTAAFNSALLGVVG